MITFTAARYHYESFQLSMDWFLPRGSFTAVLGPSGAGKSTLLSIIAGFERLQSGKLLLADVNATDMPPAERPVTLVFQDHNAFSHLDAWSNVALGLDPGLRLNEAQKVIVAEALTRVGLADLSTRKPGEMSGGELQRVALARALVRDKPILLLDEAFASLGPGLRRAMLRLVRELHDEKGLTTVMVTHEQADAKLVADNVIFIASGVARSPVARDQFFGSKMEDDVRNYLGE